MLVVSINMLILSALLTQLAQRQTMPSLWRQILHAEREAMVARPVYMIMIGNPASAQLV